MDNMSPPILEFERTRFQLEDERGGAVGSVSLRLHAGGMHLIRAARNRWSTRLADLSTGLVGLERGAVRFLGEDWQTLSPTRKLVLRSMIGRVFSRTNWVSYLSVLDNVILPHVHHTRRPIPYWVKRASSLAQDFGLPGLPLDRPERVPDVDLYRSACVRAFLGSPWLIILDEPDGSDPYDFLVPLVDHARRAQNRGAAVLWFTRADRIWNHPALATRQRSRFDGVRLREAMS
jgi:phospholipid/cholesterol/gamma-HCH transport system ATP-binding protein